MIIKSDFKDYYDFLGRIHGCDPMIVYVRNRHPGDMMQVPKFIRGKWKMIEEEADHFSITFKDRLTAFSLTPHRRDLFGRGFNQVRDLVDWSVRPVFVCGKAFPIVEHANTPAHVFNEQSPLYELLSEQNLHSTIKALQPVSSTAIENLHKQTGLPILELHPFNSWGNAGTKTIHIKCRPPKLSELSFVRVYPPEQIWQDLSYWIANKINDSPDMMPPPRPPQTDLEKLQSHGFDKRTSFRHRA